MPIQYHATFDSKQRRLGNFALLSFQTKVPGPIRSLNPGDYRDAPIKSDDGGQLPGGDFIDEALFYFKANVFASQFDIRSDSDRNLVYLTLYIIECLKVISSAQTRNRASQELYQLAIDKFALPGEERFPLNHLYAKPGPDSAQMREYLRQIRQECGQRVLDLSWPADDKTPTKWWVCFAKRRFLNTTLAERK